ncbi:ribonuclease H1 domain-containing protein [Cytobacillus kochii]
MSKFYAVRKGKKTGVFETWKECEEQVKGFSGAQYKSFTDYESAEEYLNNSSHTTIDVLNKNVLKVYVDGSYSKTKNAAGFGCVFVDNNKVINTISKRVAINPEENLWNVSAEIEGALEAVRWSIENDIDQLIIFYDYEGLKNWFDGSWKANKETTQSYVKKMKEYANSIKIHFTKVKAHSGDTYNDMADELAKLALDKEVGTKEFLNKDAESIIQISLSEFEKITGDVQDENCLIELRGFKFNDSILNKLAKNIWKKKKNKIKDLKKVKIRFDVKTLIIKISFESVEGTKLDTKIKLVGE